MFSAIAEIASNFANSSSSKTSRNVCGSIEEEQSGWGHTSSLTVPSRTCTRAMRVTQSTQKRCPQLAETRRISAPLTSSAKHVPQTLSSLAKNSRRRPTASARNIENSTSLASRAVVAPVRRPDRACVEIKFQAPHDVVPVTASARWRGG